MDCRFCESELVFEPAENNFPNVLKCSCCSWFHEWHPNGLGGNPTRKQVESVLARSTDQEWIDLSNNRLFIFDGTLAEDDRHPAKNEVPF